MRRAVLILSLVMLNLYGLKAEGKQCLLKLTFIFKVSHMRVIIIMVPVWHRDE